MSPIDIGSMHWTVVLKKLNILNDEGNGTMGIEANDGTDGDEMKSLLRKSMQIYLEGLSLITFYIFSDALGTRRNNKEV